MHSSALGTTARMVLRSLSRAARLSLLTVARYSSIVFGLALSLVLAAMADLSVLDVMNRTPHIGAYRRRAGTQARASALVGDGALARTLSNSTLAIQFRLRRASRTSSLSWSKVAWDASRSSDGSTPSNALTLTTA